MAVPYPIGRRVEHPKPASEVSVVDSAISTAQKVLICLIALMWLAACGSSATEKTDTAMPTILEANGTGEADVEVETDTNESGTEMIHDIAFPKLYLATNGTAALLDKANGQIEVYSIPDLTLQSRHEEAANIDEFMISASGTTVAWRSSIHTLTVVGPAGQKSYDLPSDRGRLLNMAISDAGDQVAMLFFLELQNPRGELKQNGALEIWALPPGDQPVATMPVVLFDYGFVEADGPFSTLSVRSGKRSGGQHFGDVFRYNPEQKSMATLDVAQTNTSQWIQMTLFDQWAWGVQSDKIVGWDPTGNPVQLAGKVGDQLRFSPAGDYLLAYRVEKVIEDSSAEMLFRLIDLASLEEVKQVRQVIQDDQGAQFVLTDDLSLVEVRITVDVNLEIRDVEW